MESVAPGICRGLFFSLFFSIFHSISTRARHAGLLRYLQQGIHFIIPFELFTLTKKHIISDNQARDGGTDPQEVLGKNEYQHHSNANGKYYKPA